MSVFLLLWSVWLVYFCPLASDMFNLFFFFWKFPFDGLYFIANQNSEIERHIALGRLATYSANSITGNLFSWPVAHILG